MANAICIRKAQTTGVRIKDERDGFAIDFARDSVWFRVQHVSLLCQPGAVQPRLDVSATSYRTCLRQQDANHEKAKRMPVTASPIVLDLASLTRTARVTIPASRKHRRRMKRRTPLCFDPQRHERPAGRTGIRIEHGSREGKT